MNQHESAAAQVAGFGQRDGQRQGGRHHRIDRVAALLENRHAHLGGRRRIGDHEPVRGDHGCR